MTRISSLSLSALLLLSGCNGWSIYTTCGDEDGDGVADCPTEEETAPPTGDDTGNDTAPPTDDEDTGSGPQTEVGPCDDGEDNDGDELADEADPDCYDNYDPYTGTYDPDLEEDLRDAKGSWGCVHPYDAEVETWIAENGEPDTIMYNAWDDGTVYEIWLDGVADWIYWGILDLNVDDQVDDESTDQWWCNGWWDGTDDGTDDDNDDVSEDDGDENDGNKQHNPDATDNCGDAYDGNYDGEIDTECENDSDSDSYTELSGDCNDASAYIGVFEYDPETQELFYEYDDSVDNDCDGEVDEESSYDMDGDCYCESSTCLGSSSSSCNVSDGGSHGGDCDDGNEWVHPNAEEWDGDDVGTDYDCDE